MPAPDFQFISVSWVPLDQLVYPHPVGRVLCPKCGGVGERVLFQLPTECEGCDGTGWWGGKIRQGSSESDDNETQGVAGKTRPSESGKGKS